MTKEDLRIVFMGTPDFAKASLEALVENNFNVVGVFCKEDKPKGRGMRLIAPPVKEYAVSKNIPVYQPTKIRESEVIDMLKNLNPNVIIVVAYGKILPKEILNLPKFGAINIHGSLLPKYRGAAPIQWSIINGESTAGITTMYMDEGMDTGDMITKASCTIEPTETYGTLHDKLMLIGADTLINDLNMLIENDGVLKRTKQPVEGATIAPMLSKEISKINFNENPEVICNLIRGTNPFPAAWCKLDDERVFKIYMAEKIDYVYDAKAKPGQIVCLDDKKKLFVVKCKTGYINILELKVAGSRQMTAAEYIRGGKVKVGEIFES